MNDKGRSNNIQAILRRKERAMTIWCILLTITLCLQGWYIRRLEDEIEAIKSWYPFCELLKIKIPEKDDFEWKRRNHD